MDYRQIWQCLHQTANVVSCQFSKFKNCWSIDKHKPRKI